MIKLTNPFAPKQKQALDIGLDEPHQDLEIYGDVDMSPSQCGACAGTGAFEGKICPACKGYGLVYTGTWMIIREKDR